MADGPSPTEGLGTGHVVSDGTSAVVSSTSKAQPSKKDTKAVQNIKEAYRFVGNAYALLHAVARNDEVGFYTIGSAIKDRISQIEGSDGERGQIAGLEYLRDHVDEFVEKFSKINLEDLERETKGGFTSSDSSAGGVISSGASLLDPQKDLGW